MDKQYSSRTQPDPTTASNFGLIGCTAGLNQDQNAVGNTTKELAHDSSVDLVVKITNEIERLKGILATQLQQPKLAQHVGAGPPVATNLSLEQAFKNGTLSSKLIASNCA